MSSHFIELADGSRWYFESSEPQTIDPTTLARSLAKLCRFTGHCSDFYSVAEHSIKVSLIVPSLTALLHDAPESITADLSTPLKAAMRSIYTVPNRHEAAYDRLNREAWLHIAQQYRLPAELPPEVHRADMIMCLIEAFDLLPSKGQDWGFPPDIVNEAMQLYVMRPELRPCCWDWRRAAELFEARLEELVAEHIGEPEFEEGGDEHDLAD